MNSLPSPPQYLMILHVNHFQSWVSGVIYHWLQKRSPRQTAVLIFSAGSDTFNRRVHLLHTECKSWLAAAVPICRDGALPASRSATSLPHGTNASTGTTYLASLLVSKSEQSFCRASLQMLAVPL